MHNGPVRVDDEKMSKSLGNFFTIREVLKKYPAEVIRYFLLSSHYRSAINYSEENLQTAYGALERFYNALKGMSFFELKYPDFLPNLDLSPSLQEFVKTRNTRNKVVHGVHEASKEDDLITNVCFFVESFQRSMDDDFNVPEALSCLFELAKLINKTKEEFPKKALYLAALLKYLGSILGILQEEPENFLREGGEDIDAEHVESLIAQRKQARVDKDWAKADQIRDELAALNVVLEDKDGVTTWRIERN
jgi:cysteinyl-tRNA synthetase